MTIVYIGVGSNLCGDFTSPKQNITSAAVILNISQKQEEFSKKIEGNLKKQGLRVISDLRNEKIGFKIREHSMQRYPYILVVGDREVENNQVSVRRRGGEDLGSMSIEALIDLIKQE